MNRRIKILQILAKEMEAENWIAREFGDVEEASRVPRAIRSLCIEGHVEYITGDLYKITHQGRAYLKAELARIAKEATP